MKLLLLGATGLAGQAFQAAARDRDIELCAVARQNADRRCDIAQGRALEELLDAEAPDLVVNASGLIDVAACEADPGACWRINARPAGVLATWSQKTGRPFIQISTDHYFLEGGERPHDEEAPVTLINEYARGKYAGEALALTAPLALVLRTSIVGIRGWAKPSFAEWAIDAVAHDREITLFGDAWTSSIDANTFAVAALELLIDRREAGLLNLAAGQVYSKEAFIVEIARQMKRELTRARSGSVHDTLRDRAASLGLDVSRAEAKLGRAMPTLEQVVAAVLVEHGRIRT